MQKKKHSGQKTEDDDDDDDDGEDEMWTMVVKTLYQTKIIRKLQSAARQTTALFWAPNILIQILMRRRASQAREGGTVN